MCYIDIAGDVSDYLPVSFISRCFVCGFIEAAHRLALRIFSQGDVYKLQFDLPAQSVRHFVYISDVEPASLAVPSYRATFERGRNRQSVTL